jgi:hypothetical protein
LNSEHAKSWSAVKQKIAQGELAVKDKLTQAARKTEQAQEKQVY